MKENIIYIFDSIGRNDWMKICLEGHDYKYAIEQMIQLFYQGEKVVYTEDIDNLNDEICIKSILEEEGNQIAAYTEIHDSGKVISANEVQEVTENVRADDREFVKLCKNTVKLSFFNAAQKIHHMDIPWGILTGIRPTKIVREYIEEGKSKGEIREIFSKQYKVSNSKIDLAVEVAQNELKILKQSKEKNIGLYVGIPFCPTRCLYCSFVSNSVHRAKKFIEPYLKALEKEIKASEQIIKDMNWSIESIYIGGGTPTVLMPDQLNNLLECICSSFNMEDVREFTVEAGRPDTISMEKLEVIKRNMVSRLSINPQTMNLDTLKLIGRLHTPEETIKAFAMARDVGFTNINMDIIAGLPDETLDMYKHTLTEVQNLNPENITVHTMSIKKASRLNENLDQYTMSKSSVVQQMLSYTEDYMKQNNKTPYYMYRQKNILGNLENVGYCKPGYEGIYNIQMMEEKQTIIAVGCGAVTKMVDRANNRIDRIFNMKEVEDYINRIDEMIERKKVIYDYFS